MGWHMASKSASPPTNKLSLPAAASLGVRVMAASRKRPPAALTCCASWTVDVGTAVEQSITMEPGLSPLSTPASPVSTASTWGEPVTHKMMMSECCATAMGVATV